MNASIALPCLVALSAALSLGACEGDSKTSDDLGATSSGSGSGGSTGRGSSSGTTSGGGPLQSCPDGWQLCTPSNISDIGCTPDGGLCIDELSPNYAQTGLSCGADAVREGTTCLVGSGPQVPNQNQGVLSQPNIVIMTFNTDPNQQTLENWGVWIADGGFLPTTVGQYGVGNGTVQFVRLSDSPPDQNSFPAYLQTHFDSNPTMPPYAPNNIYLLLLPSTWSDLKSFCQSEGGYHTQSYDSPYPIYAVVPNCADDVKGDVEVAASHEIVEAATDPYGTSWTFANTGATWAVLGGELGDMCESNSNHYSTPDGDFSAQYIWSNSAAKASQVPCQPWPDGQPYYDVLGPSTFVPTPPGVTVNIPLTGWANSASSSGIASDFAPISWALVAEDSPYGVDFQTSPTLSAPTITPGGQVMAQLNVPQALPGEPALGGKIGAAWVLAATSDTAYYGSAMVGVTVSCESSGDCSSEDNACSVDDAGIGSCGYNNCDASAKAFSTCSSAGSDDGVCVPYDSSSGSAVEICVQAGSLKAGAKGCHTARVVDAGPGAYCDKTSLCEGSQTPTCFSFCSAQGTCEGKQVCVGLGQYYGFCVDACTGGAPCPQGQGCYSTSSGDICYPQ